MDKKLGFGCMRLPLKDSRDHAGIDLDAFSALVDLFLSRGYHYFDTAYFYHEGKSQDAVRKCLVERHDRASFCLATKLPLVSVESAEHAREVYASQFASCGVTYFDYYLLHNINPANYKKVCDYALFPFLCERKAEGQIKHLGFSFHGTPELLETVLKEHPETEFVQLQINYLDWDDPGVQSRRCYEIARSFGKDVIVMEPCKGGELSSLPEAALARMEAARPGQSPSSWAFRFAAGLDGVIMVLSGMNSKEQILDNTAVFDALAPLTAADREILHCAVEAIEKSAAIQCTACRYCESHCPQSIPIPDCFAVYNRLVRTGLPNIKVNYDIAVRDKGHAKDCIACRACTEACPQNLDIPLLLKSVSEAFDQ